MGDDRRNRQRRDDDRGRSASARRSAPPSKPGCSGNSFNSDQLRVLHLIKENIRANAAELTAFESWRFDMPPLSMYGGFERARAAFGGEEELERILADMNRAVFDAPGSGDAAEPRPDKPLH